MTFDGVNWLSLTLWTSFGFGFLGLGLSKFLKDKVWSLNFLGALISLGLLSFVFYMFDSQQLGFQFRETAPWIPSLGLNFDFGLDGVALVLSLLTTFLIAVSVFAVPLVGEKGSYGAVSSWLLILQGTLLGTFYALDVFLFFVFWELMLLPMFFLIGLFGGKDKIRATIHFFLYTSVGSLFMLIGLVGIFMMFREQYGYFSGAYEDLLALGDLGPGSAWIFWFIALAFAIKLPLIPVHTWLPRAHVEAPTVGSVLLAGVLLKMGGYGFLRWLFPFFEIRAVTSSQYFIYLALAGIVAGAFMALRQKDIKRMIAYSSVSHMGFVVLGLFSFHTLGQAGAVFQMVSHGLTSGALFLCVGLIYHQTHSRLLAEYGGLAKVMPRFAFFFVFMTMASIGLPGLSGFVGEFMVLMGSFQAFGIPHIKVVTILAISGIIMGAVYMLKLYLGVFCGDISGVVSDKLKDLGWKEMIVCSVLAVPMLGLGICPKVILKPIEQGLKMHRYVKAQSQERVAALNGAVK